VYNTITRGLDRANCHAKKLQYVKIVYVSNVPKSEQITVSYVYIYIYINDNMCIYIYIYI